MPFRCRSCAWTWKKPPGGEVQVVNFGTARDAQIRLPLKGNKTSAQMSEEVMKVIHEKAPEAQLRRTEFVGPQVGEELATDGLTALLLVIRRYHDLLGLPFRMEVRCCGHYREYARRFPGARCLLAVPVGIFSAGPGGRSCGFGLLGQRVRDIFDRCRECFRKIRKGTPVEIVDTAITQTISRTVITHSSTLMVTLSMFFFGGPALHYFALALTIGILLGVYSSVFVSAAIALYLGVKREDLVKKVRKDEISDMVP